MAGGPQSAILRQYSPRAVRTSGTPDGSTKDHHRTLRQAGTHGDWWRGLDGLWRDHHGSVVNVTQKLRSGRFFSILEPNPADFTDNDLALGLSREVRWSGQTAGDFGYSVAQHSLLVVEIIKTLPIGRAEDILLYGLLHDSEEGLGAKDTITGLKQVIGSRYIEISLSIREAIHQKYQLPYPPPDRIAKTIKKADLVAGATEAVHLMGFTVSEYHQRIGKQPRPIEHDAIVRDLLAPWPPKLAQRRYIEKLHELTGRCETDR